MRPREYRCLLKGETQNRKANSFRIYKLRSLKDVPIYFLTNFCDSGVLIFKKIDFLLINTKKN